VTDRDLLERIAVGIERLVAIAERRQSAKANGAAVSDADLSGPHGDPKIRMRVRDWSGPDMKGKHASECPADFLDMYADLLDWSAGRDAESADPEKRKYAPLSRKDAARCRAWGARIREGKYQPSAGATGGGTSTAGDEWGQDAAGGGW
jgi:hypothetical protein